MRTNPLLSPVFFAGLLGLTAVLAGTFGAHGLRPTLSESAMQMYQIGVQYHLVHAAAMIGLAGLHARCHSRWIAAAAWCWIAGVDIFSGSLYALAISGTRWLGWITPGGGALMIAGWCCIVAAAFAHASASHADTRPAQARHDL